MHCKPIPCNENRVFPVKFSHREIPVMKTGVPAMRTGVPCNENRFFPVWKTSQGKPCSGPVLALYWPCTGPVRDCSEVKNSNTRATRALSSWLSLRLAALPTWPIVAMTSLSLSYSTPIITGHEEWFTVRKIVLKLLLYLYFRTKVLKFRHDILIK